MLLSHSKKERLKFSENMFLPISILFFSIPIIENYTLISIGQYIGTLNTVALIMLTAILGAILVRSEGISTISRIRKTVLKGESPAFELIEGGILIFSAVLLLTPGFVTDGLGLLCLMPPTRRAFAKIISTRIAILNIETPHSSRGNTIDTKFKVED